MPDINPDSLDVRLRPGCLPDCATGMRTRLRLFIRSSGIFIEGRRYKEAGVIFFGLESASNVQPDIFSYAESSRCDKLYETVDKINKQFGKKTVFRLAEGIQRPWTMKRDHLSPNYTTDWQQILVVKGAVIIADLKVTGCRIFLFLHSLF